MQLKTCRRAVTVNGPLDAPVHSHSPTPPRVYEQPVVTRAIDNNRCSPLPPFPPRQGNTVFPLSENFSPRRWSLFFSFFGGPSRVLHRVYTNSRVISPPARRVLRPKSLFCGLKPYLFCFTLCVCIVVGVIFCWFLFLAGRFDDGFPSLSLSPFFDEISSFFVPVKFENYGLCVFVRGEKFFFFWFFN